MEAHETPFAPAWVSVPLPGYRETTSGVFDIDGLPPLDEAMLVGDFRWMRRLSRDLTLDFRPNLPRLGERLRARIMLERVALAAGVRGIALPAPLVTFMRDASLQRLKPFNHFYFKISNDLRESTLFSGLYFVQFLKEFGGALGWYLLIKPGIGSCVVASHTDLSSRRPLDRWGADGEQLTFDELVQYTYYCSASFEAFLYRYWIENYIFLHWMEGRELPPELAAYAAHYR